MADAALSGRKRPRVESKHIGNKAKRAEVRAKEDTEKKKAKRKRRDDRKLLDEQLGAAAPAREVCVEAVAFYLAASILCEFTLPALLALRAALLRALISG